MTAEGRNVRGLVALWTAGACIAAGAAAAKPLSNATTTEPFLARPFLAQAAPAKEAPASRDSLFGDDKDASASRDSLFGDGRTAAAPTRAWRGFVQGELAYTYASPAHWSNMLVRAELDATGAFSENVKWKVGARVDYDAVYDVTDFYPSDVRKDQRFHAFLRENYIDIGAGDWDFRLGRQQVVWGEMVGLFFADVVTAKDLRQFILPDFEILRIPQWTLRAEYTKGDAHAELIWIPVPSYDEIGKPGAEFFPAAPAPPPGFATVYDAEQTPERDLSHTNYGARFSYLKNGWDLSAFYYGSMDSQAAYFRRIDDGPEPAYIYQARHERINQYGGTLAKDFGDFVLKAETVYTHGRNFSTLNADDDDGVVRQNTVDVVVGLDFALPSETRLNLQVFERAFTNHDPGIIPGRHETGYSVLLNLKFTDRLEGEVLWISSFNRTDWMVRPRLIWSLGNNWRLQGGVDIFGGEPTGLFGQYDDRDRIHAELRYDF
jgi:hypothetical protein